MASESSPYRAVSPTDAQATQVHIDTLRTLVQSFRSSVASKPSIDDLRRNLHGPLSFLEIVPPHLGQLYRTEWDEVPRSLQLKEMFLKRWWDTLVGSLLVQVGMDWADSLGILSDKPEAGGQDHLGEVATVRDMFLSYFVPTASDPGDQEGRYITSKIACSSYRTLLSALSAISKPATSAEKVAWVGLLPDPNAPRSPLVPLEPTPPKTASGAFLDVDEPSNIPSLKLALPSPSQTAQNVQPTKREVPSPAPSAPTVDQDPLSHLLPLLLHLLSRVSTHHSFDSIWYARQPPSMVHDSSKTKSQVQDINKQEFEKCVADIFSVPDRVANVAFSFAQRGDLKRGRDSELEDSIERLGLDKAGHMGKLSWGFAKLLIRLQMDRERHYARETKGKGKVGDPVEAEMQARGEDKAISKILNRFVRSGYLQTSAVNTTSARDVPGGPIRQAPFFDHFVPVLVESYISTPSTAAHPSRLGPSSLLGAVMKRLDPHDLQRFTMALMYWIQNRLSSAEKTTADKMHSFPARYVSTPETRSQMSQTRQGSQQIYDSMDLDTSRATQRKTDAATALLALVLGSEFGRKDAPLNGQLIDEDEDDVDEEEEDEDDETENLRRAPQNRGLWHDTMGSVLLTRPDVAWNGYMARVVTGWCFTSGGDEAVETLLLATLKTWSRKDMLKQMGESLEGFHRFFTILILTLIARLHTSRPASDPHPSLVSLSTSSAFLLAIQVHLESLATPRIRMRGMLVAEVLSEYTVGVSVGGDTKMLRFGEEIWRRPDADDANVLRSYVREVALRQNPQQDERTQDRLDWSWVGIQDTASSTAPEAQVRTDPIRVASKATLSVKSADPASTKVSAKKEAAPRPKIQIISSDTMDDWSDEELVPYDIPPSPTLSHSSAEDASEIYDPSLYAPSKKKVQAPIYITDLSAYLRAGDDAEKVEMGLRHAEMLIRKKSGWGTELEENAVDLAYALFALQDNFDHEAFEQDRQAALTALVSCCPTKVPPCIIEQYFIPQYSMSQRFAMLTALAMGARQLAGYSVPDEVRSTSLSAMSKGPYGVTTFPSKQMPPRLHQMYIGANQQESFPNLPRFSGPIESLLDDVTQAALGNAKEDAEDRIPEAAREKALTTRRFPSAARKTQPNPKESSANRIFTSLAASHFILPLVSRFWLHLRDLSTLPRSNIQLEGGETLSSYGGLGSDTLLDPLLLTKFIGTLAILMDSSRTSPQFLPLLAPEVLEFALTLSLRTRHSTHRAMKLPGSEESSESTVQSTIFELVLVVLDVCIALDAGRYLAREHARLVGGIKEWAERTWEEEEEAGRSGSLRGLPSRQARDSAGVLIRVDEIWKRVVGADLMSFS